MNRTIDTVQLLYAIAHTVILVTYSKDPFMDSHQIVTVIEFSSQTQFGKLVRMITELSKCVCEEKKRRAAFNHESKFRESVDVIPASMGLIQAWWLFDFG